MPRSGSSGPRTAATIQWVPDGPAVPVELLEALEDGDLVLFCGAGISARAGLPTFKGLVEAVRSSFVDKHPELDVLIQTAQYDRAMYALEVSYGREPVRRKVHDLLQLSPTADCTTHEALLRLATDREGNLRCVTTNFDLAFESKRPDLPMDCAPKLPIPKKERWNSLVYMHGRLSTPDNHVSNHLVLSSADFGLAYLTERWASRFITELFRRFKVLFLGYSADDPVMRYMLDAFAADRAIGESVASAFAFAPAKADRTEEVAAAWRSKGVEPILYKEDDGHERLHATIRHWADRHAMGLQGRVAIVNEHAYAPMVPSAQTQICWAVGETTGYAARIFAEMQPPPPLEWLEHFEHAGLLGCQADHHAVSLSGVCSTSARPDAKLPHTTAFLTSWLAGHLSDRRLAEWVIEHGTHLHQFFRGLVRRELTKEPSIHLPGGLQLFWKIVSSDAYAYNLNEFADTHGLIARVNGGTWDPVLRREVLFAMTPYLVLRRAWPALTESKSEDGLGAYAQGEVLVRAGQDASQLYRALTTHADRNNILAALAFDVGRLLSDACDLLVLCEQAGEDFDYSYIWRPSIEDHPQNQDFHPWLFLISLVRESIVALAGASLQQARALVDQWAASRTPLLRRVVFFAAARTTLYTESEVLRLLLESEPAWLWSHFVQRECFQALETVWPRLNDHQAVELLGVILAGPPRTMFRTDIGDEDYRAVCDESIAERLSLLRATARGLPSQGEQRFAALRPEGTKPAPTDRAYFPSWSSASWGDPTLRRFDPAYDIRKLPFDQQTGILSDITVESRYWTTWRLLVHEDIEAATKLAVAVSATKPWPATPWKELLLNLLTSGKLTTLWPELCTALTAAPELGNVALELSFVLREIGKSAPVYEEACLWTLWDRIAPGIINAEVVPNKDVVSQALNTPSGALSQVIVDRLDAYQSAAPPSIPPSMWERLTIIADPNAPGAVPAQVLLAAQLARLFHLNPEWVQSHLLPLLNWQHSPRAPALWQGYLWQFSMPPDLWPLLKADFLEAVRREGTSSDRGVAASWLVAICIHYPEWISAPEVAGALSAAAEVGRAAASHVVWRIMSGANEKADTLWRERVEPFLRESWPRQQALRAPSTSLNLARAAIHTRDEFPRAVNTLQDILVPTPDLELVTYELKKGHPTLPDEHPVELLRLLASLLDTTCQWADSSLRETLQRIVRACPECTARPEYRKIDEYALIRGM